MEAQAGCGLRNRLLEFFFNFAYVIFMVFRVFLCAKNTPHRDCILKISIQYSLFFNFV